MRVPAGTSAYEFTTRRSRFIGQAWGVAERSEAETIIRDLWNRHPDARHVVYAFVLGNPGSETLGMSDDGEPKGTAGRPVLEVLKGSEIRNCLVTVVRYFGGTKLGTGGLVHAYGDAAKGCLEQLKTQEYRILTPATITTPYESLQAIRSVLESHAAEIQEEIFGEAVIIRCGLDTDSLESLQAQLRDVSRGTIEAEIDPEGTKTA